MAEAYGREVCAFLENRVFWKTMILHEKIIEHLQKAIPYPKMDLGSWELFLRSCFIAIGPMLTGEPGIGPFSDFCASCPIHDLFQHDHHHCSLRAGLF